MFCMKQTLEQLIDESIKLELNVADVYKIFLNTFPEDSELWSMLIREEEKHADLNELNSIGKADVNAEKSRGTNIAIENQERGKAILQTKIAEGDKLINLVKTAYKQSVHDLLNGPGGKQYLTVMRAENLLPMVKAGVIKAENLKTLVEWFGVGSNFGKGGEGHAK